MPEGAPPAGFSSWAQVGKHNDEVMGAAVQRQNELEGLGAKYNDSNGTWILPDGRTTTLFPEDPGPPGVKVDHNWGAPQRGAYNSGQGPEDEDDEEERGPYGDKMPHLEDAPQYGPLGWLIGAFKRARGR